VELRASSSRAYEITLIEAQPRLGGVIDTIARDGFLCEGGPDAFLSQPPEAAALCRRLGLGDELIGTQDAQRRSFIAWRGRLLPVPEGWQLIAPATAGALWRAPWLSWRGKLRMACEPLIPARRDDDDESVAAFIRRRCGREALERVGQPMVGGIYTADLERLSLQAALPRWREMERRNGSLLRGVRAQRSADPADAEASSGPRYNLFSTLRGGMATLIEALSRRLAGGATIRRDAETVVATPGRPCTIRLASGEALSADACCLAVPAPRAAALVRAVAPDVAEELTKIPYEPVATVHVAVRREDVGHPLDGFGFVMPLSERESIVGCTFASTKFAGRAPKDCALLRVFIGGALQRELVALDDRQLERLALDVLGRILGLRATPLWVSVHRLREAMPQYHVGHLDRVDTIERRTRSMPGLYLTGNAYRGLGLPDCIRQAEATAQQIVQDLSTN